MINRLIVLRTEDGTFQVVEPVTRTIIEKGMTIYAFAIGFAVGFIDCMDAHLKNTREALARAEFCFPKLLGHEAADRVCKAYFDQGGRPFSHQYMVMIGAAEEV